VVVDCGGIVQDIKKYKSLPYADVLILDTLADYVGEELGNDSGSEHLRRKCKALARYLC